MRRLFGRTVAMAAMAFSRSGSTLPAFCSADPLHRRRLGRHPMARDTQSLLPTVPLAPSLLLNFDSQRTGSHMDKCVRTILIALAITAAPSAVSAQSIIRCVWETGNIFDATYRIGSTTWEKYDEEGQAWITMPCSYERFSGVLSVYPSCSQTVDDGRYVWSSSIDDRAVGHKVGRETLTINRVTGAARWSDRGTAIYTSQAVPDQAWDESGIGQCEPSIEPESRPRPRM